MLVVHKFQWSLINFFNHHFDHSIQSFPLRDCYKVMQVFMVTGLFAGQFYLGDTYPVVYYCRINAQGERANWLENVFIEMLTLKDISLSLSLSSISLTSIRNVKITSRASLNCPFRVHSIITLSLDVQRWMGNKNWV